jgi:hypothetical protein
MRPQIKYQSSTEVLEFYPPKGRPTSAAVTGWRSGTTSPNLWTSEAVTPDPYTDTFTAAEKGDWVLTVTNSANAVAGRRYWIKSPTGGYGTEIDVVDVPDANTLALGSPLSRAFASGGIVEGHRLARTITETSAIWRNARAEWACTYAAGVITYRQWFDVVALPLTFEEVELTEWEIEGADTEFGEATDATGQWRKLVYRAFSDIWQHIEKSRKPDWLMSRDMLRDPMIYRTLAHRYRHDEARRDDYLRLYAEALGNALNSSEAWYSDDASAVRDLYPLATTVQIGDDLVYLRGDKPHAGGVAVSTAIQQIRERVEEILENIVPDVRPDITLRKWLGSRDITTGEHTESAAVTTRQFQVIALPVREAGFLGGGSVDQWQTLQITIRYHIADRPDGWLDVHDLAASDSAAILEALMESDQWTGTQAEGAALGDAVPLTRSPTIANMGFQVLNYRILYNRCDPGEGGKWARNFTNFDELTAYLLTKDLGTIACLVDSDRNLLQLYQRTIYGVEDLNVPNIKAARRDAANLPQSTTEDHFTIVGTVQLMGWSGEVETAIQAQANNLKLVYSPTTGVDVDLCAVLDINADPIGTIYAITGLATDAMKSALKGGVNALSQPVILTGGTLALSCSASSTGQLSEILEYYPKSDGATITKI